MTVARVYPQIGLITSSTKPTQLTSLHSPFLHPPPHTASQHHNSHATNIISFSRPPQHTSPPHPQHSRTQSSPSHLLQTTYINYTLFQFFTNFLFFSTQTTYIALAKRHPKMPIMPPGQPASQACPFHDERSHLPF